ncbi:AFG1/ZapE family ATPase, partial [uncultured Microbacterium sp.]|uniref:AFG1/ZapE family ATPase n=1 Tax=uncultured Microbacterium sp. TaxID=191216 RepID=UPI0025D8E3FD
FRTIRIDGTDFRQRAIDGEAKALSGDEYRTALDAAASGSVASDDAFTDLVGHLARVHPSRFIRLIDGVDVIGLRGVEVLHDQSAALRLVAFVDRAYDAQIPIRATGVPLNTVFSEEMLGGGYRKKYLRAVSRLVALTHS